MSYIYQEDSVELAPEKISAALDPIHGPVTIFHDVVIASEMVQPYPDGRALKSRDELEAYAWTVDGRWVKAGGHPEDAIISDKSDVSGRTMSPHFVKNLKDPKTGRPCRAGVRADIHIFDKKISPELLDGMKKGKKSDVSIGFFFKKDETPGKITDGPFTGEDYDYVQRNMFHDHLAVALETKNGRCPSPYCGLGADTIRDMIAGDPFAGFAKFSDCEEKIGRENPDLSKEAIAGICGKLKKEHENKTKEDAEMHENLKKIAQQLLDEMEELKGLKDSKIDTTKQLPEWWRSINWKEGTYSTIYDNLSPETRKIITDANLCPKCEEKKFPEAPNKDEGTLGSEPEMKVPCTELLKKEHPDWSEAKIKEYCEEAKSIDAKKKKEPPKEEPKEAELTPEEKKKKEEEEAAKLEEEKKKKFPPKKDEAKLDSYAILNRANKIIKG